MQRESDHGAVDAIACAVSHPPVGGGGIEPPPPSSATATWRDHIGVGNAGYPPGARAWRSQ